MGNEDLLWSCNNFNGGIAGQQGASCGGISASAVVIGLAHRCPSADKERAKQARHNARSESGELVKSFADKFGSITCRDLLDFDFDDTESRQKALDSGGWSHKCDSYIRFLLEKLYDLDCKRENILPD